MPKSRYTCEPGRWIYRNGKPFFALIRPDPDEVGLFVSPTDLDRLAHEIAYWLNRRRAYPRADQHTTQEESKHG